MTTLKDISRETLLSLSTVSAVIGGRAKKLAISEKTVRKVLECAERLDYHPDLSARTLRCSKSRIVGLLMPNLKVEFWQNMILDLQREIRKYEGYIVLSALWDTEETIRKCMDELLCRKVDAIITSHAPLLPENLFLPVAAYDREPSAKYDTVLYGKKEALEKCLEYALSLGHRKIALAGDAEGDGNALFLKLASKYAVTPFVGEIPEKKAILDGSFYYRNTAVLGSGKDDTPTFVISLNNLTTLNLLKRASEQKKRVPEDLSLLAIDDSSVYPFLTPAISTFVRAEEGFPSLLLETLFRRMAQKDLPLQRIVPRGKLLERSSCTSCRKR
ncbi:MAG: LacI family DNA-binding transcriptional regulator [Lentisphaeria bacterium]|nr:LacI family DNA-binding transcriptional regulator [Lentisphaeria bacterium]